MFEIRVNRHPICELRYLRQNSVYFRQISAALTKRVTRLANTSFVDCLLYAGPRKTPLAKTNLGQT
jgi:hypothetical protein